MSYFTGFFEFPFDDEFGHRLSSFSDGEGSFNIFNRLIHNNGIYCSFKLHLRDDDTTWLETVRDTLRVGRINFGKANRYGDRNNNPDVTFEIDTKQGCSYLVKIFERYPLQTKKQRDFVIWAQAVREWLNHQRHDSWESMEKLRQELIETRKYKPRIIVPEKKELV